MISTAVGCRGLWPRFFVYALRDLVAAASDKMLLLSLFSVSAQGCSMSCGFEVGIFKEECLNVYCFKSFQLLPHCCSRLSQAKLSLFSPLPHLEEQ